MLFKMWKYKLRLNSAIYKHILQSQCDKQMQMREREKFAREKLIYSILQNKLSIIKMSKSFSFGIVVCVSFGFQWE